MFTARRCQGWDAVAIATPMMELLNETGRSLRSPTLTGGKVKTASSCRIVYVALAEKMRLSVMTCFSGWVLFAMDRKKGERVAFRTPLEKGGHGNCRMFLDNRT